MENLLNHKTAIITGASRGIGLATAKLFAKEGANVILTALHQSELDAVVKEVADAGGRAIGLVADSADPQAPGMVFAKAIETFGQVT
ncbi:SDR family NAD(P)-dependent oxidoreductase [Chitinophaga varians]|uniref:SDR family NAD(P)-dependent oxidoreductase n=1 Tax=Chitinophaga varians TaxID=2202339 RepID=UPI00165F5501|nr:SDR family NAD(P)-dependent oxidoreductase [Chitinophaga varians]MBC9914924.1 SDR family NAD(P)-dependent oxidoreductase [Chitinophaga varians]